MKTRAIPSICMLLAGIIRSIAGIIYGDELKSFMWSLIVVMICFYILGFIVKIVLDRNFKEMLEDAEEQTDDKELENIDENENSDKIENEFVHEKASEIDENAQVNSEE